MGVLRRWGGNRHSVEGTGVSDRRRGERTFSKVRGLTRCEAALANDVNRSSTASLGTRGSNIIEGAGHDVNLWLLWLRIPNLLQLRPMVMTAI